MKDLILGINSFFEGLKYLKENTCIRNLSLIPILLCILFFSLGMGGVVYYVDDILNLLAPEWMANLHTYLKSLVYILLALAMFVVVYFLVIIVVSIIAIPICEKLTEKVFELKNVKTKEISFLDNLKLIFRMLRASLAKLVIVIAIAILVIVATFIPILYPLAMYLTFMLVAWDMLDFSFDRDGNKTYSERIKFIKNNWLALTGFSLCLGLLLFIPFIHFILLPVAVCGAACLYININKRSE